MPSGHPAERNLENRVKEKKSRWKTSHIESEQKMGDTLSGVGEYGVIGGEKKKGEKEGEKR